MIIVSLTSKKPHSDTTVVLSPNNHRFIKHDTVISYADARIVHSQYIKQRIQERDFEPRDGFSDDVIRVIQQGLLDSPRTPRDIKKMFIESTQTGNPN